MAEGHLYKSPRQRHIAFRAMVADVFNELTKKEAEFLAVVYEERRDYFKNLELADMLMKQACIQNCVSDLTLLGENLKKAKRDDLRMRVDSYIQDHKPPQDIPERLPLAPIQARATSINDWSTDENYDPEKTTVSALGYCKPRGKKRRRVATSEEKDLDEATAIDAIMLQECDSTSYHSDDGSGSGGDTMPEDKKFMRLAQDAAKNSKDNQTKVGAVLVNPKNGTVLGTGWNRMPKDCEGKFSWDANVPLEEGKHLYVVYAIQVAILDALIVKKADVAGSVLYTTLYPSNKCAQFIREAGIREVVYISDKFHHTNFMEAARQILDGIKCRQYDEKD